MRVPVVLAIVCAAPLAAQKPDTAGAPRVTRGIPLADSAVIRELAAKQSPQPARARVTRLVIRGDTAEVTMFTKSLEQRLRYVKRAGLWALLPAPPRVAGR